ncbi:nonstructural protein 1 [Influenza C virus (C/Yamagata/1/2005)]|uniref:Non-structural protein 1 n=2 Tax=Influenza C virus TaxID=11552 RepID=A0A193PRH7_9ORTO|nr:nonstructural protein 1 [Influenza C virus (C/Yamagata/18/2004)]BAV18959.1 nonstructural protein 1 [Influenza C virus (C/Yamagata/27/2004)]BAV18969.1 nonstructural protein 1 [Influenza C virus (C/Yamagata/1/2005)]BAV18973.1 nonstructural protein 1 [Influenza C virus (C/Yamagata/3/2005)]
MSDKTVKSTNLMAFVATKMLERQEDLDTCTEMQVEKMKTSTKARLRTESSFAPRTWEDAIKDGELLFNGTILQAESPTMTPASVEMKGKKLPIDFAPSNIAPIGQNPIYLSPCIPNFDGNVWEATMYHHRGATLTKTMNCNCFQRTIWCHPNPSRMRLSYAFVLYCRNTKKICGYLIARQVAGIETGIRKCFRCIKSGFVMATDEISLTILRSIKSGAQLDPYWGNETPDIDKTEAYMLSLRETGP